jgi:hypothetical protein
MGETMGQYAARLERENAEKQARINAAVRRLDSIIAIVHTDFGQAGIGLTIVLEDFQNGLRGKR